MKIYGKSIIKATKSYLSMITFFTSKPSLVSSEFGLYYLIPYKGKTLGEIMKVDIYNTDKKYNIIYPDPPWQYKTWTAKGGAQECFCTL